jgi:hypothetical protein
MYRIASNQEIGSQFVDNGLPKQLIAPSDPNFDHANFYWRMELQGETAATTHSASTIGNDSLQMAANRYRNMVARITHGRGVGQERTISANSEQTLTIAPPWDVVPDASSHWVVAEAGWQFGVLSRTSPVQFEVPNRGGETVEISGRAANVNEVQCAAELSTVTRWQIGGGGITDADVPPTPFFGLGLGKRGGTVELSGVSFSDLTNTRTISAATLTLFYWDETGGRPNLALSSALNTEQNLIDVAPSGTLGVGDFVQVDAEVLRIDGVQEGGIRYQVTRAMHGSPPAAHETGTLVYILLRKTAIAPFPAEFFGSPYSGSWSYAAALPDVRVASAELFVNNARGVSPTKAICLTGTVDRGLRTLSGGQYSIQVDGHLAVQQSAAPAIIIEASHAVRDVFAVLGTVADAPVGLQLSIDGTAWCTITIPTGMPTSPAISGLDIGGLQMGEKLTLSVLSVGQTYPGADLTVVIRL